MPDEIIHQLTLDDGPPYSYRVLRQPAPSTHPIVLLGGVFQGMHGWPGFAEALASAADVITVDYPGCALTSTDGPPPVIVCRAVEQVVDQLGADQINLFGYSYGSVVAHYYALRHPQRVARLLLGGVPVGPAPAALLQAERLAKMVRAGQEQEFATLLTETMMCMDPQVPIAHRWVVHRLLRRSMLRHLRMPQALPIFEHSFGVAADSQTRLSGVSTLVFAAAHDTLTPVANQRAFAATIDDSSFVVLEEADHLILLERPAEVLALTLGHFQPPADVLPPQPAVAWPGWCPTS